MKVVSNCEVFQSAREAALAHASRWRQSCRLRNFVFVACLRTTSKVPTYKPLKWRPYTYDIEVNITTKMKLTFLVLLLYCFTIIHARFRIRGVVNKRDTAYRKKDINGSKCVLNETITNDYEILSSAVSESKYIFTARVLSVKKIKRGTKPNAKVFMFYKLYVRLVMKGNIDELRSHVFSGDERTLNGAIVFVEWLRTNKCAYKLYRHSSGIFLSDGYFEDSNNWNKPRLRLLNEPLPLSLYDLDRVNAALKGKCLLSCKVSAFVTS